MSTDPSPWANPADPPPGPGPGSGWNQPGPTPGGPPSASYGPVPGGYPGPATGYAPTPSAYGPPPGYPPASGYGQPYPLAGQAMPLRTDYASWGKRVGAYLIDHIPTLIGQIIFSAGYVSWLIQLTVTANSSTPDFTAGALPMMIGTVVMLVGIGWSIYNRWVVAGRTGQSLGKRVTKIRLVSEQTDAPIGTTNAFLRDLVHILDGMAYVGYLWPLWDEKKQTFSDKIMRTVVVNAS